MMSHLVCFIKSATLVIYNSQLGISIDLTAEDADQAAK